MPAKKKPDSSGDEEKKIKGSELMLMHFKSTEPYLFHDELGEPMAEIYYGGIRQIIRIKSSRFEDLLLKMYYEEEEQIPSREHVRQCKQLIGAEALLDGEKIELHVRSAKDADDCIWYDLVDEQWRAIKVTEDGWEIIDSPPPKFRRFSHQLPQVVPERNGDAKKIFDYINISDEQQRCLFLVNKIASFIPDIEHPAFLIHGGKGAAKSTTVKLLVDLVDPSKTNLLSYPTSKEERIILCQNRWFIPIDNLSKLSDDQSDDICMAITGAAYSKRALYSDRDDVIFSFKRVFAINGIPLVATRPDLLDRCILFPLEKISKDKRVKSTEFWKSFEEDKPSILGGIFSTLSKAMKIYPQVKLREYPRMASFAHWGEAIAQSLGYDDGYFSEAYEKNIRLANNEAIYENPVASAIYQLMEKRGEWKGTASELLTSLEEVAAGLRIRTHGNRWPKSAAALGKKISEVEHDLSECGIEIERTRKSGQMREILIKKTSGVKGKDIESLFPANEVDDGNDGNDSN